MVGMDVAVTEKQSERGDERATAEDCLVYTFPAQRVKSKDDMSSVEAQDGVADQCEFTVAACPAQQR